MPLTAAQICTLAAQDAKVPGMVSQAGQFLNATLQDLCMNYDLDQCRGLFTFNFNSATGNGSGPYALPSDYLRTEVQDGKDLFYYVINGVPYPLIQETLAEYKWQVQTPGFQSYPYNYATDTSQSPPQLFVWPPASGSYNSFLSYFRLMPDILTPETSSVTPWFPNTMILQRSVAGRLMGLSNDNRQADYLGDDPDRFPLGAGTLLKAWLKNAFDREGAVQTVGLDRRRFGRAFDRLKNTKQIGWVVLLALLLSVGAGHAQTGSPQTPTSLNNEVNTLFADNTIGAITPFNARQMYLDMVASAGNTLAANSWTLPQTYTSILINPANQTQAITTTHALSGSAVFGEQCTGLCIQVNSDTVNAGLGLNDIYINHNFGGATVRGTRTGVLVVLTQTAPNSLSNPFPAYTGLASAVVVNAGAATIIDTYFGANPQVRSAAAGAGSLYGQETDIWGTSAATQLYQIGVTGTGFFVNHGSTFEAAFAFYMGASPPYGAASAPGPGWNCGFCAAELSNAYVPISSTGTLLGVYLGSLSTIPVAIGVDLRKLVTSTADIIGANWGVSGAGNIAGSSLISNGGSIVAGINGSNGAAIALANGGVGGAFAVIKNPSTTVTYNFNLPATAGTAGDVSLSGGGVAAPNTWLTPGNLTSANDTNVTITLGGTPTAALLRAASLTMGWTGTLAVARGGTGGGSASGTLLDNITGFASTGFIFRTGAGAYSFQAIGVSTVCTVTVGNTYTFTNGILTTKGANCT